MSSASARTAGDASRERSCIGGASTLATPSGLSRAIRFGTSSPNTTDATVIPATTIASAAALACGAIQGSAAKLSSRRCATVAPPIAPVRIPMTVIPNWIVERKCPCSFASARAALAPDRPSSTHCCRRLLRAETTDISDIAKTPLRRISRSRMRSSMASAVRGWWEAGSRRRPGTRAIDQDPARFPRHTLARIFNLSALLSRSSDSASRNSDRRFDLYTV